LSVRLPRPGVPLGRLPGATAAEARVRAGTWRAARRLRSRAAAGRRVLVGPWMSEVGYEVLYWIPFVRAELARLGVAPERVTVVSRGGARPWYEGMANDYVDAFDVLDPEAWRAAQEQRTAAAGGQKQRGVAAGETALLERAGLAPARMAWLHPLLMYNRLRWFFAGRDSTGALDRWCAYAPLPAPAAAPAIDLPERYVAVKAYTGGAFPGEAAHRDVLTQLVSQLAEHREVVLLGSGHRLDDHEDLPIAASDRITRLGPLAVERNLELQTAVLARAEALVATYGGFSYLGPFLGVPTLAVRGRLEDAPAHLDAMRHAERVLGARMEVGWAADGADALAARARQLF
jgi:hypothetical protein